MRTLQVWGIGAALLLALGAAAVAGEKPAAGDDARTAARPDGGNWFGNWFGGAPKPAPPAKNADKKKPDVAVKVSPAPVVDTAAAVRAREEAAYLRRLAVCDKLQEIAWETNDAELGQLAEQLVDRAWQVYNQRTANLPASRPDAEEHLLDKAQPKADVVGQRHPAALPYTVTAEDQTGGGKENRR
jgi:hypothetical protein